MSTCLPYASNAQPGAVPHSFTNTVQPSGSHACFSLFGVISRPMVWKKPLMRSSEGWCRAIFLPNTVASVSLVRSSSVGPRPPVVMMISARSRAVSTTWRRRAGLSPTTVW